MGQSIVGSMRSLSALYAVAQVGKLRQTLAALRSADMVAN